MIRLRYVLRLRHVLVLDLGVPVCRDHRNIAIGPFLARPFVGLRPIVGGERPLVGGGRHLLRG